MSNSDSLIALVGLALLVSILATLANWRYRRRAFGTDLEREMNARIASQPASVFSVGLSAGARALRELFQRSPDRAIERMRLLAVGLQCIAWILTAVVVIGWFALR